MNIQKTLLATLGGTLVFFFVGGLFWGFLLADFQAAHKTKIEGIINTEPNILLMILGTMVYAFLFTVIFQRWAGIKTFKTGAIAGAFIAVMIGIAGELFLLFEYTDLIDTSILMSNIVCNIFWGGLGGGVIAWILGR